MYCKHCGKEISPEADVCLSCGIIIDQKKKKNTASDTVLSKVVQIFNLCFASIFGLLSVIVLGMETTNALSLWGDGTLHNSSFSGSTSISMQIDTNMYVMLFISLFALSITAIVSMILYKATTKKINIITYFISTGFLIVLAIMFWLFILVNS